MKDIVKKLTWGSGYCYGNTRRNTDNFNLFIDTIVQARDELGLVINTMGSSEATFKLACSPAKFAEIYAKGVSLGWE